MSTLARLCPCATATWASLSASLVSGSWRSLPCSQGRLLSPIPPWAGRPGSGSWSLTSLQFPTVRPPPLSTNSTSVPGADETTVYFFCPETRGRSLEEIDLIFISDSLRGTESAKVLEHTGDHVAVENMAETKDSGSYNAASADEKSSPV
jgi:hypothetical protein